MKLLAIETSTIACSAALSIAGEVRQRFEIAPQRHAETLLPMIGELLAEAGLSPPQLDAVIFGRGPGAFTGVRIAAACAQGIGFGAEVPVIPVSTLAILALGAVRSGGGPCIMAMMDARMHEVYAGAYRAGEGSLVTPCAPEAVCAPGDVTIPVGADSWYGVGDAWSAYGEELRARFGARLAGFDPARYPEARDAAELGAYIYKSGGAVSAEEALPVYLRDRVAVKRGQT